MVDPYKLDDTPATLISIDPKVPPLVDGERDAQDEGSDEDCGQSSSVSPQLMHGVVCRFLCFSLFERHISVVGFHSSTRSIRDWEIPIAGYPSEYVPLKLFDTAC